MTKWIITLFAILASSYVWLSPVQAQEGSDDFFQSTLQKAQSGNADAQVDLALLYEYGEGVAVDYTQATKWYRRAAVQGDKVAQWSLGTMYQLGFGTTSNDVKAYLWYSLSAAQGDPDAQDLKSDLAEDMTPEQIAKAERLAAACLASNYKNCD